MTPLSAVASRKHVVLSLLMLGVSAVAIYQVGFDIPFLNIHVGVPNYPLRARQFPLTVALPMFFLAVYQVVADLRGKRPTAVEEPAVELVPADVPVGEYEPLFVEPTNASARQVFGALVWFGGFFVAVWFFGFLWAIPGFTFVYLMVVSREKWWWSALGAALSWLFIYLFFVRLLTLPLLPGELFKMLGLV